MLLTIFLICLSICYRCAKLDLNNINSADPPMLWMSHITKFWRCIVTKVTDVLLNEKHVRTHAASILLESSLSTWPRILESTHKPVALRCHPASASNTARQPPLAPSMMAFSAIAAALSLCLSEYNPLTSLCDQIGHNVHWGSCVYIQIVARYRTAFWIDWSIT